MSFVMRKPAFWVCENKDADQLRDNPEADQRLCFRYTDSSIPQLPKYEITSLLPSSLTVQARLVSDLVGNPEDRFSHNEAHIVKLGFIGVYFFLIFTPKHRLWVLVRAASLRRF